MYTFHFGRFFGILTAKTYRTKIWYDSHAQLRCFKLDQSQKLSLCDFLDY